MKPRDCYPWLRRSCSKLPGSWSGFSTQFSCQFSCALSCALIAKFPTLFLLLAEWIHVRVHMLVSCRVGSKKIAGQRVHPTSTSSHQSEARVDRIDTLHQPRFVCWMPSRLSLGSSKKKCLARPFPLCVRWFSQQTPQSHGFLMVFLSFSHHFPWFPYHFPIISHGFPILFPSFPIVDFPDLLWFGLHIIFQLHVVLGKTWSVPGRQNWRNGH